jgi:Fe-S cluster assembly protein SufD
MQKQFKDETMSNYETQQLQALDELLINQFEEENHLVTAYDIPKVTALREKHFKDFLTTGFPDSTHEKWRFSEIESMLEQQYVHALEPQITEKNIEELFRCEVHNFNTEIISLLNGWFHDSDSGLQTTLMV